MRIPFVRDCVRVVVQGRTGRVSFISIIPKRNENVFGLSKYSTTNIMNGTASANMKSSKHDEKERHRNAKKEYKAEIKCREDDPPISPKEINDARAREVMSRYKKDMGELNGEEAEPKSGKNKTTFQQEVKSKHSGSIKSMYAASSEDLDAGDGMTATITDDKNDLPPFKTPHIKTDEEMRHEIAVAPGVAL